jgi:hypothetical protein
MVKKQAAASDLRAHVVCLRAAKTNGHSLAEVRRSSECLRMSAFAPNDQLVGAH